MTFLISFLDLIKLVDAEVFFYVYSFKVTSVFRLPSCLLLLLYLHNLVISDPHTRRLADCYQWIYMQLD